MLSSGDLLSLLITAHRKSRSKQGTQIKGAFAVLARKNYEQLALN